MDPSIYSEKSIYRLAFTLANKSIQYNQIQTAPQLGLVPWERPEGLSYISAGLVQPDVNGDHMFYHAQDFRAAFDTILGPHMGVASIRRSLTIDPVYVTTTLSYSRSHPTGMSWLDVNCNGEGLAQHYICPASSVTMSANQTCCPKQVLTVLCNCQPTPGHHSAMLAVPLAYFAKLEKIMCVRNRILSAYQHSLHTL